MAQNKISDKDRRTIYRFAHIFKDHPEIYIDYYNQLLAGNPDPKLNDDLIRRSLNLSESSSANFWGPESTGDANQDKINKDAHSRYMSFGRQGEIGYDVRIRGLKVKDALIDVPGGFLGGIGKTAAHIGFGIEDAVLSIGKGISEWGGLATDIASAKISDATGKDVQTEAGKYIDENFPEIHTTGASAFIGTAGQFIGGYKIGEQILRRTVGKKGKAWLAARAAGADAVVGKRISSIGQTTLKYGTPALIGEPLVATSEDMTVLQALSPLTERYLGFRMAKEMPDPRDPSLSPEQRAKNLLIQKLRFGLEAPLVVGGLSAGFEGLVKFASPHLLWAGSKGKGALGWAYNQGAAVIKSQKTGIPQTIRGVKWARKQFGELPGVRRIPSVKDWKLYNPAIQISKNNRVDTGIQKAVGMIDSALRIVRTNEALTPEAKALQRQAIQQIEKIKRSVLGRFQVMNNSMHKVADDMTLKGKDLSKWEQKIMQEDLIKYVTNPELKSKNLFKGTTKEFKYNAQQLRREMVTLKRMYNRLGLPFDEASGTIAKNMHEYLASSFKIINDSSYTVAPEAIEGVVNMVKGMLRFDKKLLSEREAIAKQIRSGERTGTIDDAYEQLLDERSLAHVNKLIDLASDEKMSAAKLIQLANKELEQIGGIQSLNRLKGGKPLPKLVDRLYGKVDDSKVVLTDTIMELTDAIVKTRMYDDMARSGLGKWLFDSSDGLVKATGALTPLRQIKITGPGHSDIAKSMHNKWTVPAMKESIENMGPVLWTDRFINNSLIKNYLQVKALSQVTKTVLSPTTQIRNVTSAANFALAAGHIGNGASFKQAFDYIVKDVFTPNGVFDDKIFKSKMEEYVEQGIVNSNMIVKELEFLVKDATKGRPSIISTDDLFKRLYENKYMEGAVDLYRSGDDIWKIYGYEFEKSLIKPGINNLDDVVKYHKEIFGRTFDADSFILKAAGYKPNLQDMKYLPNLTDDQIDVAVREIAGEVVKNVYPNYNYVPSLIQNLRRIPYGNFISFPAEMMRTQANLVRYSLNELASTNPVVRQNGARRIMGLSTALTLPFVAAESAQKLMGVSDSMLNSLQDSFTPSWNQEGPIAITDVKVNEKGQTIAKYIPTGYQFPHVAVTIGPFYKALDAIESGKAAGDTGFKIFTDATLEALFTTLQPFSGEQILTQAWNDVTTRGGQTAEGRKIYYDHDSPGEKFTKSVAHILGASMVPGAVPQFQKLTDSVYNLFQEDRKDMIYSNQGLPYDFGTEAMATFLGVREYEVNVHKSFEKYEIGAFARTLESTRAKAAAQIYDENMSPDQMIEAFYNQQLEEYRVFNTFYETYLDAARWGVSQAEAYKMMEGKTGLTKRDALKLVKGNFNPASLPNFTIDGRIYEILENRGYSRSEAADFMRKVAYEMQRIQRDFSSVPLGWTKEKIEAFINFKKQKDYLQSTQGQQQSSLQGEQLPITQPQTTAAAPQATSSAAAGPAMAAGPKTVRERIVEDDPFLKDLA